MDIWADYVRPGHVPEHDVTMVEGSRPWGDKWRGHPEAKPGGVCFVEEALDPRKPCPLCQNAIVRGSDFYCPMCHASGWDAKLDANYRAEVARIEWEVAQEAKRREEELGTFASRHHGEKKSA